MKLNFKTLCACLALVAYSEIAITVVSDNSFFYDSDKAIRKIEKKSKRSRMIGYVMSALLVMFVLWLWFRDF